MLVRFILATAVLTAALVGGGCASADRPAVRLGETSRDAVLEQLGPDARMTDDGVATDIRNEWPTVVGFVYVEAPEGQPVQWKAEMVGNVVHVLAFQTINIEAVYEGPLPEELRKGLAAPSEEPGVDDDELLDQLVAFFDRRIRKGMSPEWTDPELLADEKYRSRFMGVYAVALGGLRGRGELSRSAFGQWSASVRGANPHHLRVEYLSGDRYRIRMTSSAALGPVPVL